MGKMAICPKCKNEYREGFTICPDCGVLLVDDETDLKEEEEALSEEELKEQKALAEETATLLRSARNGSVYQNSAQKAEENRSSGWVLMIVGGLGILMLFLGMFGVLPFHVGNSYLFYGVMSAVFILFLVMGVVSMRSAKIFAGRAKSEDSLVDSLLAYSSENLIAERIDAQIEDASELSEEVLYFRRVEVIRNCMNHQFMNLDETLLDNLIDTKIYEQVFGSEERDL